MHTILRLARSRSVRAAVCVGALGGAVALHPAAPGGASVATAAPPNSLAATHASTGGCCKRASSAGERARADQVAALVADLRAAVHDDSQLVTTDVELEPYGHDAYSYHSGLPPDVVVFPSSTEEVSALVQVCARRRVPIIARGAGTSLEGHTTTPYRGVCIDLSHMDTIVAVRPGDLDCTVQAGVRWQDLNAHLAPSKLFFAMDPGPGATIGGMCGTGCSGTNAVRYGTMKANVLSLTVVLPDGRVIKTGGRARKSSAGYDLTSLFIGSEGTLGIVTEATLKLVNVPPETAVAAVSFPSIRAASDAVVSLLQAGVQLAAVELLDAKMISAVNAQSGFAYPVTPHVFFKFSGSPAKVADDAAAVQAVAKAAGCATFQWARDAEGQHKLWEARKVALWSAGAMNTAKRILTTDVCVPVSRMPDLMAAMEERVASSPLAVYAVAHVGDGNAHHFIAFDPANPAEAAEAQALNAFLVATAIGMEGTCTGEHGVGVGKKKYLHAEFGHGALAAMHAVKAAFDPAGIMNPGKKLPPLEGPPLVSGGACACSSAASGGSGSGCRGKSAGAGAASAAAVAMAPPFSAASVCDAAELSVRGCCGSGEMA